MNKENFVKALQELRKNEKKVNFNQTLDLLINLRDFDLRRSSIDIVVDVPHKIKDKKIAGFLENKSDLITTITKPEFVKFKDKKVMKKLINNYDFFISIAKLMPSVATSFGRVLGPQGKMPSPKLGLLMKETDEDIKKMIDKINKSVKIKTKDVSVKIAIGKQDMKDEDIADNCLSVYSAVLKNLPKDKVNIKSVMVKFTMTKPVKVVE